MQYQKHSSLHLDNRQCAKEFASHSSVHCLIAERPQLQPQPQPQLISPQGMLISQRCVSVASSNHYACERSCSNASSTSSLEAYSEISSNSSNRSVSQFPRLPSPDDNDVDQEEEDVVVPHHCFSSSATINRHTRVAHNELEKTRRANLRGYLDNLKDLLPVTFENSRNTTLFLLTSARNYIIELAESLSSAQAKKITLEEKQKFLRQSIEKARFEQTKSSVSNSLDSTNDFVSAMETTTCCSKDSSDNSLSSLRSTAPMSLSPTRGYQIDFYLDGLLPAIPLLYPRISVYPYLDVQRPVPNCAFPTLKL